MRVLAIETATAVGSVAVVGPDGVLAERSGRTAGRHLEWLMDAIASTLSEGGLASEAIDGLAVSIGPGSFMGLRVGVMTAATWAETSPRPLVGVSTLEAIAAGICTVDMAGRLVLAVMDARRGEVVAALFRCPESRGEIPDCLTGTLLVPPAELWGRLPAITEPVIVVGDALGQHAAIITQAPAAIAASADSWWPRAAVVGALGRRRLQRGERADPRHLTPRYTREPDAREWPGKYE